MTLTFPVWKFIVNARHFIPISIYGGSRAQQHSCPDFWCISESAFNFQQRILKYFTRNSEYTNDLPQSLVESDIQRTDLQVTILVIFALQIRIPMIQSISDYLPISKAIITVTKNKKAPFSNLQTNGHQIVRHIPTK